MTWVYLLQSVRVPTRRYVGLTADLERRLHQHNSGNGGLYTTHFAPWNLVVALQFTNAIRAKAFEQYLKSGSGHSFSDRHFW